MKKFLALILTLALVMSMSIVAFATTDTIESATDNTETDNKENAASQNVIVNVGENITTVYHVLVVWDDLTFTYNLGEWNVKDHTYGGAFVDDDKEIKLENHSNAAVTYTVTNGCAADEKFTVTVTNGTNDLDSADSAAFFEGAAGDDGLAGGHDVFAHLERVVRHVVVDADGEVVLLFALHVVEDRFDLRRGGILGTQAVTAGEQSQAAACFIQRGAHIFKKRLAQRAGLLSAVEHGQHAAAFRNRRDKMLQ